jgi:cytochrome P450
MDGLLSVPARRCGSRFDPPESYERQQQERALDQVMLWDGSKVWFVTRHADMRTVLGDSRFSADVANDGFPWVTRTSEAVSEEFRTLIRMDPPEHHRIRRLLAPEFTWDRAQQLRPVVTEIVNNAVDEMASHDPPRDLVSAVAAVVPARAIGTVLGVPYEDQLRLQELSTRSQSMEPSVEQVRADLQDLRHYLEQLVEAKRTQPSDDVLSRLVVRDQGGPALDRDAVVAIARLLLLPTSDIAANMIALGFLALHEHPGQLARLRRDPGLIGSAADELLRYLSVLHTGLPRVAVEDVELSGCLIRAGEGVICSLPTANRDSDQFPDPSQLDIARDSRRHLAFGHGIHRCLGQFLARVELEVALGTLLHRPPGLRPAVAIDRLRFRDDMLVYGVHELPVTWEAVPGVSAL